MSISWGTIKQIAILVGPMLLPKAIGYYRSVRAAPSIHGIPIRPVPANVARALAILFITAAGFLFKSLPFFSPENIFSLTQSRLQIPTDVLFTRLSGLRTAGLTATDDILRSKINSLESRLLYLQFGPGVITDCQFCNVEDPKSYLYYALPAILGPYLYNLCILALVTSGLFIGKEGAVWRTTATLAGSAIALLEVYLVSSYHYQGNARATRLEDLDAFYWKMRIYRSLMIAAVDGVIGWVLYLSSTNRAFVNPPSTAERVETATRIVEMMRSKLNAMGIVRNTVNRDTDLRTRSQNYWVQESMIMGALMEDREVIDGVKNALENRINMQTIATDAGTYAENILGPIEADLGMNGQT
ncbi:hypothetical protein BP5796_02632 [Coleophoma crateriformis]|uniref:Chorismate synthase protein n=1 Tax=Coleophoma crateriformis TaxID=565419 RepID=A0A3D8SYR7_9HELO|nr:hypothetical protein BP5796_02632 [Coleophoma crateriformis]